MPRPGGGGADELVERLRCDACDGVNLAAFRACRAAQPEERAEILHEKRLGPAQDRKAFAAGLVDQPPDQRLSQSRRLLDQIFEQRDLAGSQHLDEQLRRRALLLEHPCGEPRCGRAAGIQFSVRAHGGPDGGFHDVVDLCRFEIVAVQDLGA